MAFNVIISAPFQCNSTEILLVDIGKEELMEISKCHTVENCDMSIWYSRGVTLRCRMHCSLPTLLVAVQT